MCPLALTGLLVLGPADLTSPQRWQRTTSQPYSPSGNQGEAGLLGPLPLSRGHGFPGHREARVLSHPHMACGELVPLPEEAGAVAGSGVAHGSVGPQGALVCRPSQASFVLSHLQGAEPVLRGCPGTPEAECLRSRDLLHEQQIPGGVSALAQDSEALRGALSCTVDIPLWCQLPGGPCTQHSSQAFRVLCVQGQGCCWERGMWRRQPHLWPGLSHPVCQASCPPSLTPPPPSSASPEAAPAEWDGRHSSFSPGAPSPG